VQRISTGTPTLTLRAPIATEEERALFQRRLALTALVVFALGFGFFVLTVAIILVVNPARLHYLFTDTSSRIHLATSFAAGALWFAVRRGKASVPLLSTLDFAVGVGLCVGDTCHSEPPAYAHSSAQLMKNVRQ
jgi:hypothetical protein